MSGETVFHADDMKNIEAGLREPEYKTGFDRNFWVWEKYQPGSTYLLSADVARGDGKGLFNIPHIQNRNNGTCRRVSGEGNTRLIR